MNPKTLAALLATALLLAGCVAKPDPTTTPSSPTTTPPAPGPVKVRHGLLTDASSSAGQGRYYVNAEGTIHVDVRVNGTSVHNGPVTGNQSWTFNLDHGQSALNVTLEGTGVHAWNNQTLVRLASTDIDLNYCLWHPDHPTEIHHDAFTIWIDVDARPSAHYYKDNATTALDAFTAHDHLALLETDFHRSVNYSFNRDFGFFVNKIDGAPGAPGVFWSYAVNGNEADGISIQKIRPGDQVAWSLQCAPDS